MGAVRRMVSLVLTNRYVTATCKPPGAQTWSPEAAEPLLQSSSKDLPSDLFKAKMNKADKEACSIVGADLAKKLQEHGITQVQLEGKYKYHGRVKMFVDAMREGGVKC